jgi:hypothetical protein
MKKSFFVSLIIHVISLFFVKACAIRRASNNNSIVETDSIGQVNSIQNAKQNLPTFKLSIQPSTNKHDFMLTISLLNCNDYAEYYLTSDDLNMKIIASNGDLKGFSGFGISLTDKCFTQQKSDDAIIFKCSLTYLTYNNIDLFLAKQGPNVKIVLSKKNNKGVKIIGECLLSIPLGNQSVNTFAKNIEELENRFDELTDQLTTCTNLLYRVYTDKLYKKVNTDFKAEGIDIDNSKPYNERAAITLIKSLRQYLGMPNYEFPKPFGEEIFAQELERFFWSYILYISLIYTGFSPNELTNLWQAMFFPANEFDDFNSRLVNILINKGFTKKDAKQYSEKFEAYYEKMKNKIEKNQDEESDQSLYRQFAVKIVTNIVKIR